MRPTVNTAGLDQLRAQLSRAADLYPSAVIGSALKASAAPMLGVARQEAPIGKGYERVSLRHRQSTSANYYRRGGATRRDLRIKSVKLGGGLTGVLVGVSKLKGRVGWRTHFTTMGTVHNRKNDFISRTFNRTFTQFVQDFGKLMIDRAVRYFNR